jgi:hypothetical protein
VINVNFRKLDGWSVLTVEETTNIAIVMFCLVRLIPTAHGLDCVRSTSFVPAFSTQPGPTNPPTHHVGEEKFYAPREIF